MYHPLIHSLQRGHSTFPPPPMNDLRINVFRVQSSVLLASLSNFPSADRAIYRKLRKSNANKSKSPRTKGSASSHQENQSKPQIYVEAGWVASHHYKVSDFFFLLIKPESRTLFFHRVLHPILFFIPMDTEIIRLPHDF
jgi:hypothetical protein